MVPVPRQLYSTHVMSALFLTSLRLASPLSAEAAPKVSAARANALFFVFQGKLGVPGLPGYPGRQGPKVTGVDPAPNWCGMRWGARQTLARLCWWCWAEPPLMRGGGTAASPTA